MGPTMLFNDLGVRINFNHHLAEYIKNASLYIEKEVDCRPERH